MAGSSHETHLRGSLTPSLVRERVGRWLQSGGASDRAPSSPAAPLAWLSRRPSADAALGPRARASAPAAPIDNAATVLPVDLIKRLRLCNTLALLGSAIMLPWLAFELLCGETANLPYEVTFLASFVAVLALNAVRAHRAARLLLVVVANACVLSGALMFQRTSGGTLPFFALVGLPLMLFGPTDRLMLFAGAVLPALLFAVTATDVAVRWLSIHPKAAPGWYFTANAASAFALGFIVPFFFYRSNLRAEATIDHMGREKLQRVIDTNLIGVVRGRLSGFIEEANDTFLRLLGYTRQDLLAGAVDLKALAPLDPMESCCARALAELSKGGQTSVYERTFLRRDGVTVPALVGLALLDQSHDEVIGFVLDLTAQKHVEAQRAMLHESEEALRLRDLFSSIASHELKTPLAALMLNLQMLRRRLDRDAPAADATLRSRVERCETCASRMGELIHALLDVAQIHDGKLNLSMHEVDVVEAARRIAGAFELTRNGGFQQIDVVADGPVDARLDPARFDQVLSNLLSNAVKYGYGDPIEVRVSRNRAADTARIEVADNGPGIDAAMKEKIFEPFQRAVSADEPIPGLGLGLYVVRMIVESHGGQISVESQPGRGSRFVVELPCAGAPQPQPQPA
jgi:PAS domain S-box-containing protein